MTALPGETMKRFNKTTDFLSKIKPYLIRPTFFIPIKGTPLFDYCKENNLFKKKSQITNHFSESVLKFDALSDIEILRMNTLLPWYLNIKMGLKEYEEFIEKFENFTYEEFKDKMTSILSLDKKLSEKNKGVEHYCYFQNNLNYLVLNKKN